MNKWVHVTNQEHMHFFNNTISLCGELGSPNIQTDSSKGSNSLKCNECQRILEIPKSLREVCNVCGKTKHKKDVNRVDYPLHVCITCEPGYKKNQYCV